MSKQSAAVIRIELEKQTLTFEQGSTKRSFQISSGKSTTPTPAGHFKVRSKHRWYTLQELKATEGITIPMPYWLMIEPNRAIGIHGVYDLWGGEYPASGGCIRMEWSEAEWLFAKTPVGTDVFTTGSASDYVKTHAVFPWQQAKVKDLLVPWPKGGYAFRKVGVTDEMRRTLRDLWAKKRLGVSRPLPSLIGKDPRWRNGRFISFPNIPELGMIEEQTFDECQRRYFTREQFEALIGERMTVDKKW